MGRHLDTAATPAGISAFVRGARMRIIAGDLKGRRLETPDWSGLRPTSDKLRETLFNVLGPQRRGGASARWLCRHRRGRHRSAEPGRGARHVCRQRPAGGRARPGQPAPLRPRRAAMLLSALSLRGWGRGSTATPFDIIFARLRPTVRRTWQPALATAAGIASADDTGHRRAREARSAAGAGGRAGADAGLVSGDSASGVLPIATASSVQTYTSTLSNLEHFRIAPMSQSSPSIPARSTRSRWGTWTSSSAARGSSTGSSSPS